MHVVEGKIQKHSQTEHLCWWWCHVWGGGQGTPEFIYKKLCIYSYMFKLQSPSKCFLFDPIHLSRHFSTTQNRFWTHPFWCLLVLLMFFISLLQHQQNSSLWGSFSSRETKKKVTRGEIRWIGKVRHGGHVIFGLELPNTQHSVGSCAHKLPIMKWANTLKESSKNIHWSWT